MLAVMVCVSLLVLGRKHMGGGGLSHVNAQGHCVIICTAPWLLSTCSKGRKVFPSEVDIQTSIIVIYL